MITEKFDLFWVFYVFVIELLQDNDTESFNQFISDANPFIWEGQSWDPSLYDDFSSKFDLNGSFEDNGYNFIISYLESMDEIYYEIKKIKEYVCKEKFVNSMSNIFANGFEFYFDKYGIKK